jgi:TPR repeat protein
MGGAPSVQDAEIKADAGDASAQFDHGLRLMNGDGLEMNKSEATRYFKEVADQGNANAQFQYGLALFEGQIGGCSLLQTISRSRECESSMRLWFGALAR